MTNSLVKHFVFTALLILFFPLAGNAQFFWNTDFEYGVYQSQPRKWTVEGEGKDYSARIDSSISRSGRKSLFVMLDQAETYTYLSLAAELLAGKHIKVEGYVQIQKADSLHFSLMIFDPATGSAVSSSSAQPGKDGWQEVALDTELKDAFSSDNLLIALAAGGSGSFWFDDVKITIDGQQVGRGEPDFREPTSEEIALLNSRAVPISPEIGDTGAANDRISAMVGSSRMAALGENSHGSSTIYKLKLRLLKYLVQEKGFTTFALEMPAVEADFINDYVHGDNGTAGEILAKLTYPSWQVQEILDIIEWIRDYNAGHDRKVDFRGFDMQNGEPAIAESIVIASKVDDRFLRLVNIYLW